MSEYTTKDQLQIGARFWGFDSNRRLYTKENGNRPVYEYHFYPIEIVGETTRSWISNEGTKYPKNNPFSEKGTNYGRNKTLIDDNTKEDMIWVDKHGYQIINKINLTKDIKLLKLIAEYIGYEY